MRQCQSGKKCRADFFRLSFRVRVSGLASWQLVAECPLDGPVVAAIFQAASSTVSEGRGREDLHPSIHDNGWGHACPGGWLVVSMGS